MTFRLRTIPTFLRAMGRMLKNIFTRKAVLVPLELADARETLCKKCPHYFESQCGICSCFVGAKVMLASESCPIGKWGKYSGRS